jgi:hypothetical protein
MTRPTCDNCGAEMLADICPRLFGLKPLPPGFVRRCWLCSFCWHRKVETLSVGRP